MVDYKNPVPVAVGLIRIDDGFLVVQRAIPPIGGWALPGGFINENEDAETAVSREIFEETGLHIHYKLWTPLFTSVTPRNQLLIFMKAAAHLDKCATSVFVPNTEVSAVKIARPGDELCFPLHTQALAAMRF